MPQLQIYENLYYVFTRLVLRCRQDARGRFAKMRSDVLVKMELLDNKHGKLTICCDGKILYNFIKLLVKKLMFVVLIEFDWQNIIA